MRAGNRTLFSVSQRRARRAIARPRHCGAPARRRAEGADCPGSRASRPHVSARRAPGGEARPAPPGAPGKQADSDGCRHNRQGGPPRQRRTMVLCRPPPRYALIPCMNAPRPAMRDSATAVPGAQPLHDDPHSPHAVRVVRERRAFPPRAPRSPAMPRNRAPEQPGPGRRAGAISGCAGLQAGIPQAPPSRQARPERPAPAGPGSPAEPRNRAAPVGAAPPCANVRAGTPAHPGSPPAPRPTCANVRAGTPAHPGSAPREPLALASKSGDARAPRECALAGAGGGGA